MVDYELRTYISILGQKVESLNVSIEKLLMLSEVIRTIKIQELKNQELNNVLLKDILAELKKHH